MQPQFGTFNPIWPKHEPNSSDNLRIGAYAPNYGIPSTSLLVGPLPYALRQRHRANDIDADIVLRPPVDHHAGQAADGPLRRSISSLRGLADDSGAGRQVHNRATVVLQVRVRGEHKILRCLEPGAEGQVPLLLQIRKRLLPVGVRVVDHAGRLAELGGSQLDGLVRGLWLAHVTVDEDDIVAEALL